MMTQICRTNSTQLVRDDGLTAPIIDKHQTRRLYHLQRPPNVNTTLHLDNSDADYNTKGYFQVDRKSVSPMRTVCHRPGDVSTTRCSLTTAETYPSPMPSFRQETTTNNGIAPGVIPPLVSDRVIRSRLGPDGTLLSPRRARKQTEDYFQHQGHFSSQPDLRYDTENQKKLTTNGSPRQSVYGSHQQFAHNEIPPDTKRSVGVSTSKDPVQKSPSFSSLYDVRSRDVLSWDRAQLRNTHYFQKPIVNIAPLSRAHQISGYSGSIGGDKIQDIDNPTVDFQPYTVLRTEQPKHLIASGQSNILFYTGNAHWAKVDPVSHYDKYGEAYTTSAEVHKPLPIDTSAYRHGNLYGIFSKSVTTVVPYNPYNRMDNTSATVNGSLDTRPHLILRQLPPTKLPPPTKTTKKEEPSVKT